MSTLVYSQETHLAFGVLAGNYDEYFGMSTDVEAVVYLMLMNTMIHDYFPTAITIGEDVSGMPTFCRSFCLPSQRFTCYLFSIVPG